MYFSCTILQKWIFSPNSFTTKGYTFCVFFLFSKDNRWGRATIVSLLPCWVIRLLTIWFSDFWSTLHSPTHEQRGAITALHFVTLGIEISWFVDNYILIIFYKPMRFIRVHSLVYFLSTVDACSDGLYIYITLVRTALLRVGG